MEVRALTTASTLSPRLGRAHAKTSYESWATEECEKCESKAENRVYKSNDYMNKYAKLWLRVF